MNRPCARPYQATCGMAKMYGTSCGSAAGKQFAYGQNSRIPSCGCRMKETSDDSKKERYLYADNLEPAMAYVPCQKFSDTFDLCYALNVGTIFPQLCKPFCGKRGVRR